MGPLVIPLVTAGLDIVRSAAQGLINKKLSDYTYKKDVQMFNLSNAYNSPAAQMARYSAAGLNPNLIYQQGSSGNVSATMPKYQKPDVSLPQFNPLEMMSKYMDIEKTKAATDLLKQQYDLSEQKLAWNDILKELDLLKLNMTEPGMFKAWQLANNIDPKLKSLSEYTLQG